MPPVFVDGKPVFIDGKPAFSEEPCGCCGFDCEAGCPGGTMGPFTFVWPYWDDVDGGIPFLGVSQASTFRTGTSSSGGCEKHFVYCEYPLQGNAGTPDTSDDYAVWPCGDVNITHDPDTGVTCISVGDAAEFGDCFSDPSGAIFCGGVGGLELPGNGAWEGYSIIWG